MTWSEQTHLVTSDLVTASFFNQTIDNATWLGNNHEHFTDVGAGGGGAIKQPCCIVTNSVNQSIGSGAETNLSFDTDVSDTDGMHNTSTNKERIVIPAGLGGKYLVWCIFSFDANAAGYRRCKIRMNNGTTIVPMAESDEINAGASDPYIITLSAVIPMVPGNYVYASEEQNSGSPLNAFITYDNTFGVIRLSA